jgi:hypothetical protein
MDPAELSRAFDIEPEHCFRAGDSWDARSVKATDSRVHPESYWLGELNPTGRRLALGLPLLGDPQIAQSQVTTFSRNLSWALTLGCTWFFKTHADLLRRIRSEGGEVALLVTTYSTDSFSLAPVVSKVLGELGITIEFELASE